MEETWYMKQNWEYNVKNCNIPVERSVMVCDQIDDHPWLTHDAGYLLSELKIKKEKALLCGCGRWIWIQFDDVADAVAFKLLWEGNNAI